MKLEKEPRIPATITAQFAQLVLEWGRRVAISVNAIYDGLAQQLANVTNLSGPTTGGLQIGAPTAAGVSGGATLRIDKHGNAQATVEGTRDGVLRWQIALGDAASETGANAGSNFSIASFADGGGALGNVFTITRATGRALFAGALAAASFEKTQPANFITSSGVFADGPNWANNILTANPAFEACSLQVYNAAGTWAGFRMVVGTTAPAVYEYRNTGVAVAVQWLSASDRRVKANLAPIERATEKLLQVSGYTFNRLDMRGMDGIAPRRAGLIADEWQAVLPESVHQDAPTEGNPDPIRMLSWDGPVALLVQSFEEQHAEIQRLRERIDAIERNGHG